jgi:hypothetical protein
MVVFPLYLGIYEIVKRYQPLYWLTLFGFVLLAMIYSYAHALGKWVA